MEKKLSHIDSDGKAVMVDVGDKSITKRTATARSLVNLPQEVLSAVKNGDVQSKKGPVIEVARLAGIMGAKKTSELIPMCHPLMINKVDLDIELVDDRFEIECTVACMGKTGVEMEALTGASIAALTIYDMCKALSHDIVLNETRLVSKTGGKSDIHL